MPTADIMPDGLAPEQDWLTTDTDALHDLMRLRRDLASPPMLCAWEHLHQLWAYDHYRLICARPETLEDYPELPVRLRGALGRALRELEPRYTLTGRGIPHAYDVLFTPLARRDPGTEAPRPLVIRAIVEGQTLNVDLLVFGDAMPWAQDAVIGMTNALQRGIALSSTGRARGAIQVEQVTRRRVNAAPSPSSASYASLSFQTPVTVRLGERLSDDPRSILRSTLRRVGSMARWQGVAVPPPAREMLEELDQLAFDTLDLSRYAWIRHSRRQGDNPIPMRGHLGRLIVRGKLEALLPALSLAETCNTGSHAALGLGWFDLVLI